tara:strand:+ start:1377 stop:1598 length:222 start_codon:yes stop_codon:yes gene_type:complete
MNILKKLLKMVDYNLITYYMNLTRRFRKIKRGGKWSLKYKKSINCRRPKGFSQRQHCKYGRKKKHNKSRKAKK